MDLNVVLGHTGLLRHVYGLLLHRVLVGDLVDERNHQVKSGVQHALEAPEPLDHIGRTLRHFLGGLDHRDDDDQQNDQRHDGRRIHIHVVSLKKCAPSRRKLSTQPGHGPPASGQARESFSGLTRSVIPRWPTTQTVSPTSNSLESHSAFHSTPLSLTLPAPRSKAWVTFTRAPRADTGSWSPSQRSLTFPRNQTLIFSRARRSAATLSTANNTICSAGAETSPSAVASPTRIAPTPKNTATIPVAKNSDRTSNAPRISQNQGSCSIFDAPTPTGSTEIIGGWRKARHPAGDSALALADGIRGESILHIE